MDEGGSKFNAVMGREDTIAALQELQGQFERGEIRCAALRLFHGDGTWADIVLGGGAEEQARALEDLQRSHERAN